MPKLPKELAREMTEEGLGEGGPQNRGAIEGYVLAKVVEATEEDEKDSGYAGQTLKFEVLEPVAHAGDWIWDYLSYSPKSAWKWRRLWDATGFEYDSDTDELVEDEIEVILYCVPEVQMRGKNKGKEKTTVEDYFDAQDDDTYALVGEKIDPTDRDI